MNNGFGKVCSVCSEIPSYGDKPYQEDKHDSLSDCFSTVKYTFSEKTLELEDHIEQLRLEISRVGDRQ